jgi:hypothetical protein
VALTTVYTNFSFFSFFNILNVKESLVLAERREQARLIFRITFEITKKENEAICFYIVLPFELRNGKKGLITRRQDSLLDPKKIATLGLFMEFEEGTFAFSELQKENRIIVLENEKGDSKNICIPKKDEYRVYESSYFEVSADDVQSPFSILCVEFYNPLPKGLYTIKFYCYIKDFLGKIAEYLIFEHGRILETSVWNNIGLKKQILTSEEKMDMDDKITLKSKKNKKKEHDYKEMIFDYLELFVVTPSNIVVSDVAPKEFSHRIFTQYEEAGLKGIRDSVDPAKIDYAPYKGRHQYRWVFYPDSKEKFISLTLWPSSSMPILLLFAVFLLDFLAILFLISSADKLLAITIFMFLAILGIFNFFVFSSIGRPGIIQGVYHFITRIGYTPILNQIFGIVFSFLLISSALYVFRRYLDIKISPIWSFLALTILVIVLVSDVRRNPAIHTEKFFQILLYRNLIGIITSLIISVLTLNLFFYLVSPSWILKNSLSFYILVFSLHLGAGKAYEFWEKKD